jgi:hypothetical protein
MPTDTTTETKTTAQTTTPAQAPAETPKTPVLNMLKVLGYAADAVEDPAALEPEEPAAPEADATTAPAEDAAPAGSAEAAAPVAKAETPRAKKIPKPSALDALPERKEAAETPPPITPEVIENAVDRALQKTAQATAPSGPDDSTLPPEDRKAIELAEYAAKIDPKYAELPQKQRAFLATRNNHITEWLKENQVAPGSEEFGEYLNSAEYRSFVRSASPQITPLEREAIRERMIEDRTVAKMRHETAATQAEFERKLLRVELSPAIKQAADEVAANVIDIEDDAVKAFKDNPQAAYESNPAETPIINVFAEKARKLTAEYLEIDRGITMPDGTNPVHVELDKFIEGQGRLVDELEKPIMRNGKQVVSPAKYRELRNRRDPLIAKYEPLNSRDIVVLIQQAHKSGIESELKRVRDTLAKSGYARAPKPSSLSASDSASAAAATKPAPKEPVHSPKSIATRAPGPSGKPAAKPPTTMMKALGYA